MGQTVGTISKKSHMTYCWELANDASPVWLWKSPDFTDSPFNNVCFFWLNRADGMLSVCHRASMKSFSFDVNVVLKYKCGARTANFTLSKLKKCDQSGENNTDEYLLKPIDMENLDHIYFTFVNVYEVCSTDLENGKQETKVVYQEKEEEGEKEKESVYCGISESAETRGLVALSANLRELFDNEEDSDVVIQVGDQKYHAHKIILRSRSPVFRAMLKHDMAEKNQGVVDIPDCDPCAFRDFLQYLYAGKLDNISEENVFELYRMSDKYDVRELKMDCVDFMLGNLTVEIIGDVISLASTHGEAQLLSRATEFFEENAKDILPTVNWQKFVRGNPIEANELFIKAFK